MNGTPASEGPTENDFMSRCCFKFLPPHHASLASNQYRKEVKLALTWLASSLSLEATIGNPLIPTKVGIGLGSAAQVPLIKPVVTNLTSHIKACNTELPTKQKWQCLAISGVFLAVHGLIIFEACKSQEPIEKKLPLSLLLSNLTSMGSIFLSSRILHNHRKSLSRSSTSISEVSSTKPTVDEYSKSETIKLEKEIKILEEEIQKIDSFVIEHKELYDLCNEYFKSNLDYIAKYTLPDCSKLDPNDPVDKLTLTRNKLTILKHEKSERIDFFSRNKQIYEYLEKYLAEKRDSSQKQESTEGKPITSQTNETESAYTSYQTENLMEQVD